MKLSDVKGERAYDAIVECIEPVANIASDPIASRFFKREIVPKGKTQEQFVLEKLKASMPALLQQHKADVTKILATIEGVSKEEYIQKLDMVKLLNDCFSLITDEAFLSLFTSAQKQTGKESSGSAQENTRTQA